MGTLIDLTGKKFGWWQVICFIGRRKLISTWKCQCVCGKVMAVNGSNLRRGLSVSCGCFREQFQRDCSRFKGEDPTSEFNTWTSMKQRCSNPKNPRYNSYGGRGIKVCSRWQNSFEAFIADMGPKPTPKHSLDRIDNDGNYEPSNCRWATNQEQCNNKRTNTLLTLNGKTQNVSQWTKELGFRHDAVIVKRMIRGWSIEKTLTTPLNRIKRKEKPSAQAS